MLVIIILAFKEVRNTRICILFKNLVLCSPCEWKIEKNKAEKRPSGDWDCYPSLFPTMDISFLFSALVSSPRTCRGLLECLWTLVSFSKFSDSLINGA